MSVDRIRHCSDLELLAYLDGELSWWRRLQVRRHLQMCWKCRSQAHAHEEQICRLTEHVETWEYPGGQWHLDQQLELGRRLRSFERLKELEGPDRIALSRPVALIGVAAMAVMLVLLILRPAPPGPRPAVRVLPAEVVAGAQKFEEALYQHPVEQTLLVQVGHVAAARKAEVSQVQIWSDARAGRFASRWTAEDGTLKEALWRPGPGREYLLRPRISDSVLQRPDHRANADLITDFLDPEDFNDLEGVFKRWMESRPWAPVSFSPEAAQWMSGEDTGAHAEQFTRPDGTHEIRISVQRRLNGADARLTIEFDAATSQPRSMSIQWQVGGRVAELRMIAKAVRRVQEPEIEAAMSVSDIRRVPGLKTIEAPRPEIREKPELKVPTISVDFAERTVEAQFVLHGAGACLGDPVVVEDAPGGVRVRSVRGSAGRWPEALTSSANLADVLGALADLRNEQHAPPPPAVSAGIQKALSQARALRMLAKRFPRDLTAVLPERSRHLLESMLQSHIEGVRSALTDFDPAAVSQWRTQALTGDWRDATAVLYEALSKSVEQPVSRATSPGRISDLLQFLPEQFARETGASADQDPMPGIKLKH